MYAVLSLGGVLQRAPHSTFVFIVGQWTSLYSYSRVLYVVMHALMTMQVSYNVVDATS